MPYAEDYLKGGRKKTKKRRAPASQGHPSRGGTTVSGGTKKNPKTRPYVSPTPSPTVAPVSDVRARGDKAPRGSGYTTRKERVRENRRERRYALRQLRRALKGSDKGPTPFGRKRSTSKPLGLSKPERAQQREDHAILKDFLKLSAPEKEVKRSERTRAAERLADRGAVVSLHERETELAQLRKALTERARRQAKKDDGNVLEDVGGAIGGAVKSIVHKNTPAGQTEQAVKANTVLKNWAKLMGPGKMTERQVATAGVTPGKVAKYLDVPVHVGRALLTDPKSRKKTLQSIPGILAGLAPGAVMAAKTAVEDPGKLEDAIKADFKERYGQGRYEDVKKGMRKHGGVLYALDVGAGVGLGGRAATAGLKVAPKTRAFVTDARPGLRLAEGEPGIVRRQRVSKNAAKIVAQRALDRAQKVAYDRRIAKDIKKNRKTRGVQPLPGEVVRPRRLQGASLKRKLYGDKGRDVIRYSAALTRSLHDVRRDNARLTRKQRKHGAAAYAEELGLPAATSPAAIKSGKQALIQHLAQVKARRKSEGLEKLPRGEVDEIADLEYLVDNYEKVFTPKLIQTAERMRETSMTAGLEDPAFRQFTAQRRARGPQARVTGQSLEHADVEIPGPAYGLEHVDDNVMFHGTKPEAAAAIEREGFKLGPETDSIYLGSKDIATHYDKGAMLRAQATPKNAIRTDSNEYIRIVKPTSTPAERAAALRAAGYDAVVQVGKGRTEAIIALDPAIVKVVKNGSGPGWHVTRDGKRIPQRFKTKKEALAHQKKLEALPAMTRRETDAEVLARLDAAAEAAGLRPGGYFPHGPGESAGDFTAGMNLSAKAGVKPTAYERFGLGTVPRDFESFEQGLARNLKHRFQWDQNARLMDELALVRRTGKDGKPLRTGTFKEWRQHFRSAGRNEDDFVFVNSVKFTRRDDEADFEDLGAAVDEAKTWRELEGSPDAYESSTKWVAVPRAAYEALSSPTPHGVGKLGSIVGRGIGKAIKGIPSKLILGLNPSWAVLQVINDATLAVLAGVGPGTIARSEQFWRTAGGKDVLERVQPYVGATHFEREMTGRGQRLGHLIDSELTDTLGSMANAVRNSPLRVPGKAGELAYAHRNPLDWLFQFTHYEADKFRRALLYKQMERQAYEDMGAALGDAMNMIDPLQQVFNPARPARTVRERIADLSHNRELMEEFGTHVDRMMGNYTRFTPKERAILERNVMFYGFLRFSLRYALWTMPTRHPVVSSLAGHMSQLHEAEVRKLLGVKSDEPLLPGLLSKYYYLDGGVLKELPMQRANPALNAITQANGLNALVGTLPPLVQELLNQIASKDLYFNQDFRLEGDPALSHEPRLLDQKLGGFGSLVTPGAPRFRIALANLLSALAPYRTFVAPGKDRSPMSSESEPLFYDKVPMRYVDPDIAADIELQRREDMRRPDWEVIRNSMVIPWAQDSRDRERERRYLENLQIRPQSAADKKMKRIKKFDNDEYFNIWIDKRIQQKQRELQRKLDAAGL